MIMEETGGRLGGPPEAVRRARMLAACRRIGDGGVHTDRIVRAIQEMPGLTQASLARRLEMNEGYLQRLLEELAAHGLIERREIDDARADGSHGMVGYSLWLSRDGWEEIVTALRAFIDGFRAPTQGALA